MRSVVDALRPSTSQMSNNTSVTAEIIIEITLQQLTSHQLLRGNYSLCRCVVQYLMPDWHFQDLKIIAVDATLNRFNHLRQLYAPRIHNQDNGVRRILDLRLQITAPTRLPGARRV